MTDYRAMARQAAVAAGIDADLFERQIDQESGFAPDVIECRRGSSAGAQGIAQIVPRFHPGVDPCDPPAALDYAARLMRNHLAVHAGDWARALSAYNAGPYATQQGLEGKLDGWPYRETVNYVRIILDITEAEARRRLTGTATVPTPPPYNPDTPLILQNDDFSCWPTSARMALEALGRRPQEGWIEPQAIMDGIVSTDLGLLDASGGPAAAWLTRQYSDPSEGTPTITARSNGSVTFDDVRSVAGTTSVLLGGRRWGNGGHWCFVRRYDPATDQLVLGNPAGTYGGVGQTMDRQQFNRVGPCSMIVLTADGAEPVPGPTPADPKDARIAELEKEVARLNGELADRNSRLGVAAVDYVRGLRDLANAYEALKPSA